MPKAVFFSELQEGKRGRGAPRKRYKDQLRRQLAQAGISHQSWQQEASDRDSWRSSMRKASCEFEAERHKAAKEKTQGAETASIPSPLHPKPSSVQSVEGDAHQESVSTATNEHARIDHQPSQQSSFANNEPSFWCSPERGAVVIGVCSFVLNFVRHIFTHQPSEWCFAPFWLAALRFREFQKFVRFVSEYYVRLFS